MAQPVSTMMLKYTYLKPRQKFGKQCIFETLSPLGVENIWPNPEHAANYIQRKQCDQQMQLSTQFATHDAQTETKVSKDMGILHLEGGWPKEINPSDGEATHRFIRRVEKDPSYAASMRNLMPLMEYHVCQNNAVNIHQNFFDDMIPTHLVKQYDMRIWNSYEDPQKFVRPIRSLSWSPDGSNRLAAAYAFTEFEDYPADVNPCSYVWDIGNANKPMIELESSSAMLSLQFNPRDISMLISGHMSGQVCCWDIRIGGKPMHTSDIYYSHRYPFQLT
nr:dynein intermediate chain 2, axonemal-like [Megalopta genalis]